MKLDTFISYKTQKEILLLKHTSQRGLKDIITFNNKLRTSKYGSKVENDQTSENFDGFKCS